MSEHYDQALVDELGEIVADMLLEESGALTRSTGFCVATGRVAAAVLDRLVELGWSPNVIHLTLDNTEGKFTPDPLRIITHLLPTTAAIEGMAEIAGHEGHTLLVRYSALGNRVERCESCGEGL